MAKKIFCVLIVALFVCSIVPIGSAEVVSGQLSSWYMGQYYYSSSNTVSNPNNGTAFATASPSIYLAGVSTSNYNDRTYQIFTSLNYTFGQYNFFQADYLFSGSYVFDFWYWANNTSLAQRQTYMSYLDLDRLSELSIHFYLADNRTLQNALNVLELLPGEDLALDTSWENTGDNRATKELTIDFEFWVPSSVDWGPFYLICMIDVDSMVDWNSLPSTWWSRGYYHQQMSGTVSYDTEADNPFLPDPGDPEEPVDPGEDIGDAIIAGQDREEQKNQQAVGDALENGEAADSVFDLSSFADSFGDLFDGLNYQGTSFSFKFPASGTVPYLNMQLWTEQEIPFKYWIDQIPAAYMTIVRFVAWFALALAFVGQIRKLIADINGGGGD